MTSASSQRHPVPHTALAALASLALIVTPWAVLSSPDAAARSGVVHSYVPFAGALANPDRGFFHYTETHARADGSGRSPLDAAQLVRWRVEETVTLVYRIFYLERFSGGVALDAATLGAVRDDLASARAAGVRLVVRFAYSDTSGADAAPDVVVAHIRQLAPVLNADSDVIAVLQAGFVGRWGEWYYSDHFASDPTRPWLLTDADWAARGLVLRTLLATTEGSLSVQVRYPAIARRLLAAEPAATVRRVGLHNDCFLGSDDDMGTFGRDADRQWLRAASRVATVGGETCAVHQPRSLWPTAQRELALYRWSFLNRDYHPQVIASWGPSAIQEIGRRLGYRVRLTSATLPTSVAAGGTLVLRLSLTNDGYAAPVRPRPARLVLTGPARTYRVALPLDLRDLAPGGTVAVSATMTAPRDPGGYAVSVAFPDLSPRLADRPAYAVRLANRGLWNSATGTNSLQHQIWVRSAAGRGRQGSAPLQPSTTSGR